MGQGSRALLSRARSLGIAPFGDGEAAMARSTLTAQIWGMAQAMSPLLASHADYASRCAFCSGNARKEAFELACCAAGPGELAGALRFEQWLREAEGSSTTASVGPFAHAASCCAWLHGLEAFRQGREEDYARIDDALRAAGLDPQRSRLECLEWSYTRPAFWSGYGTGESMNRAVALARSPEYAREAAAKAAGWLRSVQRLAQMGKIAPGQAGEAAALFELADLKAELAQAPGKKGAGRRCL